jgi:hypothetical protein
MNNIENKLDEILERIMKIELRLLQIEKQLGENKHSFMIQSPPNPHPFNFPPYI